MDQDTFKLDKRKSPIIRPKPRPDSMLQAEPAPDVEFDNSDDLIQKLPRPKPRPVMIGSNPKTGATRGIDPALNYSPEDLKRLLMQSAMERLQTEGEAGDHDRMYKVVHVKKGMMDIKAKTSYEAAKKFAQEKGLKSTAGVDVHLYPLEEAKLDKNFFRNIASMDQPHEEIYRLLTADGPEGDVIRREYEITAGENGLHPDDDFEEILDMMVHDFEDMTFESVAKFYDEYDTPVKVEVTDDKILYNGAPIDRYSWQIAQTILTPQMYKNAKSWDDVHAYLKSAEEKGQLQQAMQATFDANPEGITVEGKNKMGPQGIKPGDRVEHEGDMYEVVAVDGYILTVKNLQNGNRTQFAMDDVTRLSGMDAMTDKDKQDAEAMFKRLKKAGSGSLKHVATEGDGRKKGIHPKGHPMRQKQQAAIHANSVDLNAMRDALKLDESTDANTIVAQYTRATLDQRHDTWGKVCEQIDHIKSFVKEDVDVENVRLQIRKMHEQEGLDRKIQVQEDIDKLRQIVKDKSAMPIKFADGSMKVDMTTASIFLQAFDKMKERNQEKVADMMQTKAGFLKVLDFIYGAIK